MAVVDNTSVSFACGKLLARLYDVHRASLLRSGCCVNCRYFSTFIAVYHVVSSIYSTPLFFPGGRWFTVLASRLRGARHKIRARTILLTNVPSFSVESNEFQIHFNASWLVGTVNGLPFPLQTGLHQQH